MYHVENETKQRVYKMFGKTEQTVKEDIKTIRKWLETQHHLPEIMDDRKIGNMLNLCKFDMDKVKQKIDNYYTIRNKYPDLFEDSNPNLPHLKKVLEKTHISNHPVCLDGIHRVCFVKPKEPNTLDPKSVAKIYLALLEVRLQDDFMVDDFAIVDMANITFKDMCKLTLPLLYKSFTVYKEIYSIRVYAAYHINSPSYATLFLKILKFILPAKIFGRVKVYSDAEILKELFSMDALPKDYGGNGPSLDELDELAKEKFVEFKDRFEFLDRLKVDESLRPRE